jgi:periplasmic protein TonB
MEARQARAEGTTLLRVHVATDGRIDDVQVERSAGHAALDRAAASAVRRWRFEPARDATGPVAVWVVIPVNFRLTGDF